LSGWRSLLGRKLDGLSDLEQEGQPVPDWVLGGGTALMLYANHRFSRDIDAFIDDPKYLGVLSPETTDVWSCKKMYHRATMLKPRDIFDIAVIEKIDVGSLIANLREVASRKDDLVRRLVSIRVDYLKADLAELDIQPGWKHEKETCLETVRSLVAQIPEAGYALYGKCV
jgi:hypothetical protein